MYFGEKPRKGLSKFVAVLTALAIASASLLAVPAYAEGPLGAASDLAESVVDTLISQGISTRASSVPASDTDTRSTYTDANALGPVTSTQFDGRVWTDKSVSTDDISFSGDAGQDNTIELSANGDFLVTYSALATTTSIAGQSNVPVDVVFVIDTSASMEDNNRARNLASALNESIEELMVMNAQNRVSVVAYSQYPEILLPLDHYTKSTSTGWWGQQETHDYVTFDEGGRFSSQSITVRGTNTSGQDVNNERSISGGTNIHLGVDAGMDVLATEESTSVEIAGNTVNRVPFLILLSDGYPSYSGSDNDNWWDPRQNATSGNGSTGQGTSRYEKFSMKTIMNAAYNKQRVNQHYGVTDERYAMRVYGIGVEMSGANTTEGRLGRITLDPSGHLNDNNTISNDIRTQWNNYQNNRRAQLDGYTFDHPQTGDIDSIAYNDGYYDVDDASSMTSVFQNIVSEISTSIPSYPTAVSGNDPVHSGYLSYSDTIGEYMQVNDVPTILYGGVRIDRDATVAESTNDQGEQVKTYTFTHEIDNPVYENVLNANVINVQVTTHADGTQTLTVDVPAAAIPLRVNTVTTDTDGNITNDVTSDAYPLRVVYEVGMKEGTVDDSDNIIVGDDGVSQEYIDEHTVDGKVEFFSNAYSGNAVDGATVGDATVTFTPASTNPFYYTHENTPLFADPECNQPVTGNNFNSSGTYYYQVHYYNGNAEATAVGQVSGSDIENSVTRVDGQWNINPNTFVDGMDAAIAKASNNTSTAEQRYASEANNGVVTQYLGNNGKLKFDVPASLTVAKTVTANEGLTAPATEFNYTIHIDGKSGDVNAIKTTPAAEQGGQPTTETVTLSFVNGDATFSLGDGQSIEIPGMSGVTCTVTEAQVSGFNISNLSVANGFKTIESDLSTGSIKGTVNATTRLDFTNKYTVTPLDQTPTDLGLTLTKNIANRDFESGDRFSFTINRSEYAQDSPLPDQREVTIAPKSGSTATAQFTNDNAFHFTKPSGDNGFRYIITENQVSAHGVTKDSAIYRLVVHVDDNGKGGLVVTSKELTKYNAETTQWDVVDNGDIAFTNTYSATETQVALSGMKYLDGRDLLDTDNFIFDIARGGSRDLGSTGEFVEDGSQPLPYATQVKAAATGSVLFGDMTFGVANIDKEYRYVITENITGIDDQSDKDGLQHDGITYDTAEKVVIVKVEAVPAQDGSGDVVNVTVCDEQGNPIEGTAPDFSFTNVYNATGTLDGATYLKVAKTLEGRAWNENDSFTFELSSSNGAPMPDESAVVTITDASDNHAASFGSIAFDQDDLVDAEGNYVSKKTFEYGIRETGVSSNGLTLSDETYKVAVTVSDNGDGTLGVSSVMTKVSDGATVENSVAAFTNTYSSTFDTDTAINLNGTKTLTNPKWPTGTELSANDFAFTVEAVDGAPMGYTSTTNYNQAGNAVEGQEGTFSAAITLLNNITFNQDDLVVEGQPVATRDFQYIISEQNGGDAGYTYDSTQYRVTVSVTDDQKGEITASIKSIEKRDNADADWEAVEGEAAQAVQFNNSYAPVDETLTAVDLRLTKELTGNRSTPLAKNEFTFTMRVTAADGSDINSVTLPDTLTAGNTADDAAEDGVYVGGISFGDITFTKAGTFTVHVKENVPENAEVDEEKGTWTLNGVTGSTAEHTFTYNVEDNNGNLVATPDGAQSTGGSVFTNIYAATGSQDLTGSKNITGRDFEEGDSFTFAVSGSGKTLDGSTDIEAPKPSGVDDNWQLTINPTQGERDQIPFDTVTFTQPGVYTYTFTEVEGDLPGVTYDTAEHTVVFTVTDTGLGQLDVKVTSGDLTDAVTWTNRYFPTDGDTYATTELGGTKTFTGRDMLADEEFKFVLEPSTTDAGTTGAGYSTADMLKHGVITLDKTEATVTGLKNAASSDTASFDFGDITFKPVDLGAGITLSGTGTFTFNVSEVLPQGVDEQNKTADGITYDTHVGTLTVTVTDLDENGKHTGKLTATPQFDEGAFAFENSYNAERATFSIDADSAFSKVLDGRDWLASDQFKFRITTGAGNPLPSGGDAPADVPNAKDVTLNADGSLAGTPELGTASDGSDHIAIDFGTFEFTFDNMKDAQVDETTGLRTKTFTYNISELNPSIAGVTQSSASYKLDITVKDNNNGSLEIVSSTITRLASDAGTPESTQLVDGEKAVFTNTYLAGNDVEAFRGTKTYNDTTQTGDQLKSDMFAFMLIPTGGTDAQGQQIDAADVPMPTASADAPQDIDSDALTYTVYNNTSNFNFPGIEYTQDDDGNTYTYKVVEAVQDADGTWKPVTEVAERNDAGEYVINGMKYDASEKTISVVVTTDTTTNPGVAQIVATPSFGNGNLNFNNEYRASGTIGENGEGQLRVTKKVAGTEFTADMEFNFTLKLTGMDKGAALDGVQVEGANGQMVALTNDGIVRTITGGDGVDENGQKTTGFGKMTFTKTGDYTFTVSENEADADAPEHWTYDNSGKTIAVHVTDPKQDGKLQVDVDSYDTTFVNVYYNNDEAKTAETAQNGVVVDETGKTAGVGDTIHYTIRWANNAVDEDDVPATATVTITDKIPDGTTYVADSATEGGTYDEGSNTITWTFKGQQPGATGQVSFDVTVDEAAGGTTVINDPTVLVNEVDVDANSTETIIPGKEITGTSGTEGKLQVGDVLDFTITYANTTADAATVTVKDTLPGDLTYVGVTGQTPEPTVNGQELAWTIEGVDAGATGTITFQARVNESATTVDVPAQNTAYVTVGDNTYKTNTTTGGDAPATGNLSIAKNVTANQGAQVDQNKAFEFTVALTDKAGNKISGTYKATGIDDVTELTFTDGSATIELKHGQTATIEALPEGAKYTVTENLDNAEGGDDYGYTQTAPADADGNATAATGAIPEGDEDASVTFENAYTPSGTDAVPAGFEITKVLQGKKWDGDSFTFQLGKVSFNGDKSEEALAAMPMPNEATKTVSEPTGETEVDGAKYDSATFDFGAMQFTVAGIYVYQVTEVQPANTDPAYNAGIEYDTHPVTVTITVTDRNQSGASTGKLTATATVAGGDIVNTYDTGEVTVDTQGGLRVVKNLTGHDIVGDMFGFTLTATSNDAKTKFGETPKTVYTTGAQMDANAGVATETIPLQTGLTFDKSDAGKDFTFTFEETKGGDTTAGYTNDTHVYEVKFVVSDDANGTLKVETWVDDELVDTDTAAKQTRSTTPVTLTFNNTYKAGETGIGGDGQIALNATKTLTNRDMIEGEFTFNVFYQNDDQTAANPVTTGTNAAASDGVPGQITFAPITYTTDGLNALVAAGDAQISRNEETGETVYTIVYDVVEATPGYEGVKPVQDYFPVTVSVTDDGRGTLMPTITYPQVSGDALAFTNVYGEGATDQIAISGKKVYDVVEPANNAPSIVGAYKFTLTGVDKETGEDLPAELMPATTELTLDGTYGLNFGTITYKLEDVFSAEEEPADEGDIATMELSPKRTRTFVYTVTEIPLDGGVEGVHNDQNPTRTIEVTVTDNGNGTITAVKSTENETTDFTFTNTYDVDPKDSSLTGDGGFVINKTLTANTGRTLADGEFSFALTDAATGEVVKTATNDAEGKVSFPAITFAEPGTYNYALSEVDAGAASMDYDEKTYSVTAEVEDNGRGQLEITWSIEGATDSEVTFTNTYTAKPTSISFNAAKVLDGRELTDGEFTFELRENGKVIDTATNDADGTVAFEKVEYTEPGAHDYEIAEVKGDDSTITYDGTVFTVHVNVVDNTQTGSLDASDWSYGENGAPVFHNTYTKPAEPPAPKPEEPKPEVIPATGDAAAAAVMATAGIGAALAAAGYVTSKKRGE